MLPQTATVFLRAALVAPRDAQVWWAGLLLAAAACSAPTALPYAAAVVAAVFIYRVWKGARTGLAAGAALAIYAAIVTHGWTSGSRPWPTVPAVGSWPTLVLVAGLIVAATLVHDRLARVLLGAGAAYAAARSGLRVLPRTELGLGALFLGAGFIAFLAGLAVNWWLGANGARPEGRAAKPTG